MESEFAIIGGGIVGLSLAYGLLKKGKKVIVMDEGDGAFRASQGNFGLVWVQSKGLNSPNYAQWTRKSARHYQTFVDELTAYSDINAELVQDGGYMIYMSDDEIEKNASAYGALRKNLHNDYQFEIMDHKSLLVEEPNIGPKVAGAIYCPEDGHLNPLKLLKSLAIAVRKLNGQVMNGCKVIEVVNGQNGYQISTANGDHITADKVVLAAGLGAKELGPKLGFKTPIRPQQGQVLITEKMDKIIHRPNGEVRQVNEGGIQIGATKAEVGFNDKEDILTVASLAKHAVDMFPKLAEAKLLRSWAALRIMSPDGLPIYQESISHKGVFFITCHSGITLAAAHADYLTDWLIGNELSFDLSTFSEDRFHV